MEKISFYESIIQILKLISSIPFLLEVLLLTLILMIVMIVFNIKKSNKGRHVTIIIYFVTLLLLPISHLKFFINLSDKLIENFVKIVFFPSWFIYLIMLAVTDISIYNTLKKGKSKISNVLNIVYFFVFQFIFFVIVYLCAKDNINIFDTTQLYSNGRLISLLQVGSYIFWIRCGVILLSMIINKLTGAKDIEVEKMESLQEEKNIVDQKTEKNTNIENLDVDNKSKSTFVLNNKNINIENKKTNNKSSIDLIDKSLGDKVKNNINNSNIIDNKDLNKNQSFNLDLNLEENNDNKNYFDDFYD